MKLYEIDIGSLWWIAASDEFEAMELIREEFYNREISDEEIDIAMEDMLIKELRQEDAEALKVVDEYGTSTSTVWDMFRNVYEPGLITSDFQLDDSEDEDFD